MPATDTDTDFRKQDLPISQEDARAAMARIFAAYQDLQERHHQDWDNLLRAYDTGRLEATSPGQFPGLQLMAAALETQLDFIAYEDPQFVVDPARDDPAERRRAKTVAAALSTEWREARFGIEAYRWALMAKICGAGFLRIGYDEAGLFVPTGDYELDHGVDREAANPDVRTLEDMLEAAGLPVDHRGAHVFVECIQPWNMVFESGYEDVRRFPWLAIRHLMRLEDVQANPLYHDRKGLQADKGLATDKFEQRNAKGNYIGPGILGEATHIEVWEYWYYAYADRIVRDRDGAKRRKKIRETRVLWLTNAPRDDGKDSPTVLRHAVSYLDMPGYPVEELRFGYRASRFFGPSAVERMLPVADAINALFEAAVRGMQRAFAPKTLVKKGLLNPNARTKMGSNQPEVVEVSSRNLQADVRLLQMGAFPQEMPYLLNQARAFMAELGAGDETLRGSRSSAGSATETAARMSVAKTTLGTAQKRFEDGLARVAAKAFALMAQYYEAPRMALSPDGSGVEYTGASIRGDLRIRVVPGSTRPQGQEAAQQSLMGFAGALSQVATVLRATGADAALIAAFMERALDLWDQDNKDLRDAFAAMTSTALRTAGASAMAQPEGDVASGNAFNPDNGKSITRAPKIPGIGGLPSTGGLAEG